MGGGGLEWERVCVVFRMICHSLIFVSPYSWPAMCIHGDKHQSEREWVLGGKNLHHKIIFVTLFHLSLVPPFQSFEVERVPS